MLLLVASSQAVMLKCVPLVFIGVDNLCVKW